MSDKFQIGELVILRNSKAHPEYNGWLAEVVSDGRHRWTKDILTMEDVYVFCYKVRLYQGVPEDAVYCWNFTCEPWQMKKLGEDESNSEADEASTLEISG